MRNDKVDKYIEERFGKTNFLRSFINNGYRFTPIGNKVNLWRIDKLNFKENR